MFRRQIIYSPIMDCHNGEILTAEMRDNMKKEEVKTIYSGIFSYTITDTLKAMSCFAKQIPISTVPAFCKLFSL